MASEGCRALFDPAGWGSPAAVRFAPALTCTAAGAAAITVGTASLERTVASRARGRYSLREEDNGSRTVRIQPSGGTTLSELVIPTATGPWLKATITDGSAAISAADWPRAAGRFGSRFAAFATTGGADRANTPIELRLQSPRALDSCGPVPIPETESWRSATWCRNYGHNGEHRLEGHERICFDATTGSIVPLTLLDRSTARPNRGLTVVVRHCRADAVEIAMGGTRGTSLPSVTNARDPILPAEDVAATDENLEALKAELAQLREAGIPRSMESLTRALSDHITRLQQMLPEAARDTVPALFQAGGALDDADLRQTLAGLNDGQRAEAIEVLEVSEGIYESILALAHTEELAMQVREDVAGLRSRLGERQSTARGLLQPGADLRWFTVERMNRLEAALRLLAAEQNGEVTYSARSFAPRRPGNADVRLTVGELPEHVQELTVVEQRWGAVRVGLGVPIGTDLVPASYRVATIDGSTPPSRFVQLENEGGFAFEIVLGFSGFLFDVFAWGGRNDERAENARVAPFVGVGLASASVTGVDAFTSLYLGLEFEILPEFSIVPAFVMRRADVIAQPFVEGAAISQDSVPTSTEAAYGFGLVINVAPDVFQLNVPTSGEDPEDDDDDDDDDEADTDTDAEDE